VYQDALAVIDYFNANFRKEGIPVVYWGRSLGGCVAAFASGKVAPNGLILETTFPSKAQLLAHFPHLSPFRFFSKYKFDTVGYLREHQFPILVIHGDIDRTIPVEQGKALYEQLTGPKQFFLVEGAGHIDIHMVNSQIYMDKVLSFIDDVRPALVH
jgi:fermentation-respiration switch protein FrsA (DUF1100 family)